MSLARLRAVVLLGATVSLRSSAAQTQIASWISPRGAIIQDVAIIEGGLLSRGNFANGQWQQDVNTSGPANGLLYNINLCNAFDLSQGASENLLEHQNETLQSEYGIYIGGGMFVTDYEFYTYGYVQSKPMEDMLIFAAGSPLQNKLLTLPVLLMAIYTSRTVRSRPSIPGILWIGTKTLR